MRESEPGCIYSILKQKLKSALIVGFRFCKNSSSCGSVGVIYQNIDMVYRKKTCHALMVLIIVFKIRYDITVMLLLVHRKLFQCSFQPVLASCHQNHACTTRRQLLCDSLSYAGRTSADQCCFPC